MSPSPTLPVASVLSQSGLPTLTPSGDLNLFNPDVIRNLEHLSENVAKSMLIPKHYQGKPADCFIAIYRAGRVGVDPFAWMEQSYPVYGKLGIQGKMLIALMNSSGVFEGSVQWDIVGDECDVTKMSATAWAIRKGTKIRCEGYCSYAIAVKNGWVQRNDKWDTITRLMLMYRSASFLHSTHCPEIGFGMKTVEEIIDSEDTTVGVDGNRVQQLFTRPEETAPQASEELKSAVDAESVAVVDSPKEQAPENKPIDQAAQQPPASEAAPEEPVCKATGKTYKDMRAEILKKLSIDSPQRHEQMAGFLVSIKWLEGGMLFDSLQETYIERIYNGLANFNLRFCKWLSEKEKTGGK